MNNYPELVEKLRVSREDFLAAAEDVTDARAAAKPAEGGWSILECAEHVVAAEALLFRGLSLGRTPLPGGPARNLEAAILARGLDRARRFDAPEGVLPNGRFATLAEALAAFQDIRGRAIAWVESYDDDLRRCSAPHPVFGQVTGYEMVLIVAMHAMRHALQIRELRR